MNFVEHQFVEFVRNTNTYGPFMEGRAYDEGVVVKRNAHQAPHKVGSAIYWRYQPGGVLGTFAVTRNGSGSTVRRIDWMA